jgi:4'-phosphopantetheinyl transferase
MNKSAMRVLDLQAVHLWHFSTLISDAEEHTLFALLSPDEVLRAERFYFPLHRRRYIATRGFLRRILGFYLEIKPELIHFLYSSHHKPYLANIDLEFNVSHSHDMALLAFTKKHSIGVDIEKINNHFNPAVAKRFFSEPEYTHLMNRESSAQAALFYAIWSRKEAVVKAIGEGLHFPLKSFSVLVDQLELVDKTWHLKSVNIHKDYHAAFCTAESNATVSVYDLAILHEIDPS